jgi:hypothetical protein
VKKNSPLEQAHLEEALGTAEDTYNFGWYTDRNRIESKTDKGVICTTRNADGSFNHKWSAYCMGCDVYVSLSETATDTVCSKPHIRKEAA